MYTQIIILAITLGITSSLWIGFTTSTKHSRVFMHYCGIHNMLAHSLHLNTIDFIYILSSLQLWNIYLQPMPIHIFHVLLNLHSIIIYNAQLNLKRFSNLISTHGFSSSQFASIQWTSSYLLAMFIHFLEILLLFFPYLVHLTSVSTYSTSTTHILGPDGFSLWIQIKTQGLVFQMLLDPLGICTCFLFTPHCTTRPILSLTWSSSTHWGSLHNSCFARSYLLALVASYMPLDTSCYHFQQKTSPHFQWPPSISLSM